MNKLSVGKTIRDAYQFAFGHLGTVIGLIWLPMVTLTLLNFLPELTNASGDPAIAGSGAVESLAISLLTLLLYAMIYDAVIRQALGLRHGPAMVHFTLGPPEFRVFGAVLLAGLVIAFFIFVYVLGAVALTSLAVGGHGLPEGLVSAYAVLGMAALLYVAIRLGFLIAPVTVAEKKISLERAWTLTRGNFWRILAVLLAVFVPIFLIEFGFSAAIMGRQILQSLPADGLADAQAIQQHAQLIDGIIRQHLPSLVGMGLILAPFSLGLSLSAASFAYRDLSATTIAVSGSPASV